MQVHMLNNLQRNINFDMRVGNGSLRSQFHTNCANANTGSVFGPQCKVTISREGRKLSGQMKEAEPKSFTAASTERLLLRQQKQDELDKQEQSDMLGEISSLMASIKNSYAAGEDKETIANRQEALNRLLDLKARQEEENKRRVQDAADGAGGVSKEQEEIDRKNADLYLMLKSFEEKDEEDGIEEAGSGSDTADAGDGQDRIGGRFQESASQLGASAAKRELQATGLIDDMFASGYGRLAEANAMMRKVQAELDMAAESYGKEDLSEDEKNQLTTEHIERADNMMMSNYGEMMDLRRKGHQEIQDARTLKLKHITINPLDGVDEAKQTIMDAGAAAALREVPQNILEKASEELEERVQEEIDRRNSVVSGTDEDEEQEKAEEIEEQEKAEETEEQDRAEELEERKLKTKKMQFDELII